MDVYSVGIRMYLFCIYEDSREVKQTQHFHLERKL